MNEFTIEEVERMLDVYSLEELLETMGLSPSEAVLLLLEGGHVSLRDVVRPL